MKYFSLPRPGAGLVLGERDAPEPGPGQVLVRLHGWAVNARDLMILKGFYPKPVKPDVVALSDGAGEVVGVGDGVRAWSAGDRVAATYFPNWLAGPGTPEKTADDLFGSLDGTLAEYAVFPEDALVAVPAHLDYAEAATLPSSRRDGVARGRRGGRGVPRPDGAHLGQRRPVDVRPAVRSAHAAPASSRRPAPTRSWPGCVSSARPRRSTTRPPRSGASPRRSW